MKVFAIGLLILSPVFADGLLREPPAIQPPVQAPVPLVFRQKPIDLQSMINAAAQKHNVPAVFVKSIVAAESNFNPYALSPKGAIGLMQLMPQTALNMGLDPRIPEQNIDAGTRYLRWLMTKYQNCRDWLVRVIAAYNAGPGNVDRYRGVPPFKETRGYVVRVLAFLRQFELQNANAVAKATPMFATYVRRQK